MRYFKQFKGNDEVIEVTKEEAREKLEGNWQDEFLDEIFGQEKQFRLQTPFSEFWTMTEDGEVPQEGVYGAVEG